ncbi:hypothetical protein bpr_I0461 [Butyrivibrio proteoclasticus B316]|uniref:Glycosyltransferase RgtA/B/C/D-like domain-containing protein n=1 Tax=Butyrivibrio proteoclasticus (strain ATCC 51982 / DSM 14932 / B316) TaxID=515622 RepID=E0S008_BUTPB|nr:hypothetical protein [Butyrivibrio proteoclasticus]ADL33209.1 hypothetical protein bpr_I0461 [Butyrivibrio proteoclasticus B316]
MNQVFSRKKLAIHTIIVLLMSVVLGVAMLCLVYMLPTDKMKSNVAAAYDLFMDERVYHDWSNDVEYTRLDGYTDMLMYGTAIYPNDESVLNEALMNRHIDMWYEDGMDVAYYSTDSEGEYRPISYEVYWHGYLIWLKPLLLFMHPRNIRVMNMILQFVFTAYLMQILALRFRGKYSLSVISGLIVINTVSTAMCLQYSSIFYISVIGMILVLKYPMLTANRHNYSLFFLVLGIFVAYFDFLTYPPIALCMPLMMYLVMQNEENGREKESTNGVFAVLRAGIYWSIGYIGMWGSKWFLPLLVGDNRLGYVLYELGYRSGVGKVSFIEVVIEKIKVLMIKPLIVYFAICLLYLIIKVVLAVVRKKVVAPCKDFILAMIMMMAIPIAWYFVVREHSLHTFAYRELAGTIMAGMILLESFSYNREIMNIGNENRII